MTIINFGSINIDHTHLVPHFPRPGETVSDTQYIVGMGGKGANQSLAAAAAGADVRHLGAVGRDGTWAVDRLSDAGIDTTDVAVIGPATGHAVIYVDPHGENSIVIHPGANRSFTQSTVNRALDRAKPGDWFLAQAETNMVVEAAGAAHRRGLKVAFAAAPFHPTTAAEMIGLADLISVNEGEAQALANHLGTTVDELAVPSLLVTLGSRGAKFRAGSHHITVPAFPVDPIDTTGAGDVFLGFFLAGLDLGATPEDAMRRASAAAAISVTRQGAADSTPSGAEVDRFLDEHG